MGQSQSIDLSNVNIETNKTLPINVLIEYCDSWGYYGAVDNAAEAILKFYPSAKIETRAIQGFTGCFEIYVNDKLVHSKKKGEGFVRDGNKFIQRVKDASE